MIASDIGTSRPACGHVLPYGAGILMALLFLLLGLAGYARPAAPALSAEPAGSTDTYVRSTSSALDAPTVLVREQPLLPIWLANARQPGSSRLSETPQGISFFALPEQAAARYHPARASSGSPDDAPSPSRFPLLVVLRI